MSILYCIVKVLFKVIANLFFKDKYIVGLENIPKKGPVIICGNHANQFLDAVLMLSSVPRDVGFIVAAKSYRRNVIGHFAKAIHGIPVERPQDIAKPGAGKLIEITDTTILGVGTKFTEQLKPGDILKLKDVPVDIIVKTVNNDTEITYTADVDVSKSGVELPYKILPKVDQTGVYDAVWHRLIEGGCVGMFPEGGSHDRTQMLPLKAGICIMALGAMAKGCEPIKIVPCGLNYFKGYKFRSKAIVEFGTPYEVPQKLVDTYMKSKKDAIATLLKEIEKMMTTVTVAAPSYSELTSIYMARKLYVPARVTLKPSEEQLLNQILALGYNQMKDDPEVKKFFEDIRLYNQNLRRLRLEDSAVKRISSQDWKNIYNFFFSLFMLMVSGAFALPGLALNGPLALIINLLSEYERRKALAGSSVKVKGVDVVASHKVLCAIIAFPIASFFWTFVFRLLVSYFFEIKGATLNFVTLMYFLIWPIYSYIMILSADGAVRHYRNLKARFSLLAFKSKIQQLRETRKELQKQIAAFVENNARRVIDEASEDKSEDTSSSHKPNGPELPRRNSLQPDEALDQAFNILEEIGI